MKRLLIICALAFAGNNLVAQSYEQFVDSLVADLEVNAHDTTELNKLTILVRTGFAHGFGERYNDRLGEMAMELMSDPRPAVRRSGQQGRLEFWNNVGGIAWQKGDHLGAVRAYQKASSMADLLGDSSMIGTLHNNMALVYWRMDDPQHAVIEYSKALLVPVGAQSPNEISFLLLNMSMALIKLDLLDSAEHTIIRARQLAQIPAQRAWALMLEARIAEKRERLQEAEALWKQASDSAYGDPWYQVYVNLAASKWYFEHNKFSEAARAARSCSMNNGIATYPLLRCQCIIWSGKAERRLNAPKLAERDLIVGAEMARVNGQYGVTADALRDLRNLYAEEGLFGMALLRMDEMISFQDSADAVDGRAEVRRMEFQEAMLVDSLTRSTERAALERKNWMEVGKERERKRVLGFTGGGIFLVALGILLQLRSTLRSHKLIAQEKAVSDELLLNILPTEVAEELKITGTSLAREFDTATILFTDFKGFTQASERMSPQDLVEELNTCFRAFDNIITARGIEKIKTIGDAYMCAGGLPVPTSSTPAGVVQAGLEMQAFMIARKKERDAQVKPAFEMRLGIHTGPVVAGIVGVKKFAYDIWGDTVNTASRMESSGEVGHVNISEATYALVKDEPGLMFTPRGKVQAKGKGEMEMYFVI